MSDTTQLNIVFSFWRYLSFPFNTEHTTGNFPHHIVKTRVFLLILEWWSLEWSTELRKSYHSQPCHVKASLPRSHSPVTGHKWLLADFNICFLQVESRLGIQIKLLAPLSLWPSLKSLHSRLSLIANGEWRGKKGNKQSLGASHSFQLLSDEHNFYSGQRFFILIVFPFP